MYSKNYKDRYDKFEDEVLYACDWFVDIFGSNEKQGKVIFFDAFTKESSIQMDIMNNHYQKYYNGNEAPIDTQNPNPVNFLTLKNFTFKIIFAAKDRFNLSNKESKDILDFVKEELINSLEQFGIGAKTSVGYGYFDIVKTKEELEFEKKCNEAWNRVKNSTSIDELEDFISSYSKSKYVDEAKRLIDSLKKISPFDLFIESCKNSNMPLETAILKKIKEENIDSNIKKEALIYVKNLMIQNKVWKEATKAKNPKKDKSYIRTQEVISMLKECK